MEAHLESTQKTREGTALSILRTALHQGYRLYWRVFRPITVGVKVILIRDDAVCLVRLTYQPGWHLPGGGVKREETLTQAVRREAAEEIGAELGELQLFGLYSNLFEHKSDHIAVFLCRKFTLADAHSPEIQAHRFFDLDELGPGVSPATKRRIEEYLAGGSPPRLAMW
jgi:ADP-ribose pyrophosphatase YjhB (NUDIX family)